MKNTAIRKQQPTTDRQNTLSTGLPVPEVTDLGSTVSRQKNIRRLQIPVNDAGLMRDLNRSGQDDN